MTIYNRPPPLSGSDSPRRGRRLSDPNIHSCLAMGQTSAPQSPAVVHGCQKRLTRRTSKPAAGLLSRRFRSYFSKLLPLDGDEGQCSNASRILTKEVLQSFMSPAPAAHEITPCEALDLLDTRLRSVAETICQDGYAFWLGSGISLGRVAGVRCLIPRVLEHLRELVIAGDPGGRYRRTLNEIIELAKLTTAERSAIAPNVPVANWPTLDAIITHLATDYARFLDRAPDGEESDYLLWEALDVVGTYADPSIEPDSEHLCLAILILEGVASSMPSANWDGLIERAVEIVAPGSLALTVCVLPGDLREPARRTVLYKFHGCAVKAGQDEATYRRRLVGRFSQINGWAHDPANAAIKTRLIDIATTKRTLVLGLSAQDGNIQNIFQPHMRRWRGLGLSILPHMSFVRMRSASINKACSRTFIKRDTRQRRATRYIALP